MSHALRFATLSLCFLASPLFGEIVLFANEPELQLAANSPCIEKVKKPINDAEEPCKHPPLCRNACNFKNIVTADFLWWQAAYSDFAFSYYSRRIGSTGDREVIDLQPVKFPYDPGLKLGLGYALPRNDWDLFFNWTHLESHPHLTLFANEQNTIASGTIGVDSSSATKFHGTIHFNSGDFEFAQSVRAGKYNCFRFFGGLKSVWLHARGKNYYDNVIAEGSPAVNFVEEFKNNVWGIGPRIGLESRWELWSPYVAFRVSAAGSLLWENVQSVESATYTSLTGELHGGTVKLHSDNVNPFGELFVGLEFSGCPTEGFYLSAAVGYELQYVPDQFRSVGAESIESSFHMQGLTSSLTMGF